MASSSNGPSPPRRRRPIGAPLYGQVVVGPPGVGKTTYCNGMQQYLRLLGRDAWVVNLDPANEYYLVQNQQPQQPQQPQDNTSSSTTTTTISSYETILDVCTDLIQSSVVMEELSLGPNGSLLYCMEYLQQHVEDLLTLLEERIHENLEKQQQKDNAARRLPYLLLDLPGQTEVYTHGGASVSTLLQRLTKRFDLRLCTVQLLDATYCWDAHQFVSATVLGTTTMLRLEYPTVNVLSKVDLVVDNNDDNDNDDDDDKALSNNTTQLPFALDYFLECHDLERLVDYLHRGRNVGNEDDEDDDYYSTDKEYQEACRRYRQSSRRKRQKYSKLYRLLAEVVHDFGLLHFLPLDIQNATSVGRVLAAVDKANGYVFLSSSSSSPAVEEEMFRVALGQDETSLFQQLQDIAEQVQQRQRQQQRQQQT